MTWAIAIVLLLVGLAMIVKGGDMFVDAAAWMAGRTGIPRFIIGATVVSLATTMPEILVSLFAAGRGQVDMAIGNAVGSVTANTGLIMGVALICMPGVIDRGAYWLKSLLMILAAAVLAVSGLGGQVGPAAAALLFIIFAAAMADNVFQARRGEKSGETLGSWTEKTADLESLTYAATTQLPTPMGAGAAVADAKAMELPKDSGWINMGKFILGAAFVIVGSQLLVDNGSTLAVLMGVPERIIAVTIVAIGTSLPELVTTLTAISKKQSDLSAGNIIGANIIDLTLILPLSALVAGEALPISRQFAAVDIPATLIVGLIAIVPTLITGRFRRWQGIVMVTLYCLYLIITTVAI